MANPIFDELCRLGVCDAAGTELFHRGVRDRDDIDVMRCRRSGALFLHRTDHMDLAHYDAKASTHRPGAGQRQMITTNEDTQRRFKRFAPLVRGRSWLDIGAGSGAMLDVLGPLASDYAAVEPQQVASEFLRQIGHAVYRRVEEVPAGRYAVVTLFHVFEHLTDPCDLLRQLYQRMAPGGRLVIEVPHARDLLIGLARNPAFCGHTFWSEHLFLHTRETLRALVAAAGFQVVAVQGEQRYPVANHLHWLATGQPAGHLAWNMLVDDRLDNAYGDVLARLDMTDTLTLEALRPA
jgi:2-polyprenyl-3-methyl-5-hydroxy-6-metoxy-1,4-benzoquinol methylase